MRRAHGVGMGNTQADVLRRMAKDHRDRAARWLDEAKMLAPGSAHTVANDQACIEMRKAEAIEALIAENERLTARVDELRDELLRAYARETSRICGPDDPDDVEPAVGDEVKP